MALPEVLAAGQDWYPKASDLCAEYTIKLGKQDPRFGRLVTPTKDPAIAKYVADFNAATGTNDEGGLALLALVGYCNAHAMTKLGDVTAKIVREHFAAKQGSMIQPAPAESLTCGWRITKSDRDGRRCAQSLRAWVERSARVMREFLTKELGNPMSWNTALKVRTIQYGL
jgi:hypothetical protein